MGGSLANHTADFHVGLHASKSCLDFVKRHTEERKQPMNNFTKVLTKKDILESVSEIFFFSAASSFSSVPFREDDYFVASALLYTSIGTQ